jgi:hypothetical protein
MEAVRTPFTRRRLVLADLSDIARWAMRGLRDFSMRMQRGGDEYVHARQWLDQYWTVDEYPLISSASRAGWMTCTPKRSRSWPPAAGGHRPSPRGWHSLTRSV